MPRNRWLVAVWQGLGSVALRAGQVLREALDMEALPDLPSEVYHDTDRVDIRKGLAAVAPLPRHRLFAWDNPAATGPDLLLFEAEAQPVRDGMRLCRELVDLALARGCQRIVTFAALPSQMDPRQRPRVLGVANQRVLLDELRRDSIALLEQGQITGQNGLLLAAALERQVPAVGLLGEIPVIASAMTNPASTARVLEAFAALSGIPVAVDSLERQATVVQQRLVDLLERFTRGALPEALPVDLPDAAPASSARASVAARRAEDHLTASQRAQLEDLFARVAADRSHAVELKHALDRLGVYREYEDRFLDLFK